MPPAALAFRWWQGCEESHDVRQHRAASVPGAASPGFLPLLIYKSPKRRKSSGRVWRPETQAVCSGAERDNIRALESNSWVCISSSTTDRSRDLLRVTEAAQAPVSSCENGGDKSYVLGSHELSYFCAVHWGRDLQCARRFHKRCYLGKAFEKRRN